ncbi:MAG: hypothetical protein RMK18_02795 [Armatimonadota bacterium]|nr:hypothetical protein [Armatimonadota bacterium]MCX7776949.1 hypothetical protein [Armatimonadota bacterium]MDW8024783.1 hypothetical protein [Armatimonadota bacterium]
MRPDFCGQIVKLQSNLSAHWQVSPPIVRTRLQLSLKGYFWG